MNAIGELFGQAVLRRLGWVLLHFVWQGAIVAAVAAGGLHLLRRPSANARYLLACGALGLLACLPLLTAWLMPELMEEVPSAGAPMAAAAGAGLAGRPADLPPAVVLANPSAGQQPESPLPALSWPQRAARRLGPALPYVVGLWVIGVLVLSMWRAIGFARVRQLRSSGTLPTGESLAGELSALARRLGLSRPAVPGGASKRTRRPRPPNASIGDQALRGISKGSL